MTFVSIQLNSNRPDQIRRFFDHVEQTADRPEDIEVLLHIDAGDETMERLVAEEKKSRSFRLFTLQTDLVKGYQTLWQPLNPLLKMTDPEAYFLINLSDEMLFETKGWDTMLRPYVGYYPDHIFRLRGSKYRFRNYTDYWECGFAPDSLAFYTRKWLELQGDWNPCLGPDSFQQCVAYQLERSDKFNHRQFNRDIPLPFMRFSGEGASIGLEGRALYRRMCVNNRAWFVLMSHRIQQEARRRAMRMKSHMIAYSLGGASAVTLREDARERCFVLTDTQSGNLIETLPYGLSRLRIGLVNALRAPLVLYFAGGGKETLRRSPLTSMSLMLATFTPMGEDLLEAAFRLRDRYNDARGRAHHLRNHIRGVRKTHGITASTYIFVRTFVVIFLLMFPSIRRWRQQKKMHPSANHAGDIPQIRHSSTPAQTPSPHASPALFCSTRRWLAGLPGKLYHLRNHARGMLREHGFLYTIRKFPQHALIALMPMRLSQMLRGLKKKFLALHHLKNHARGMLREHGIVYSARKLPQHTLIALAPQELTEKLRRVKKKMRDLHHFRNHLRGIAQEHGFIFSCILWSKGLLRAVLPAPVKGKLRAARRRRRREQNGMPFSPLLPKARRLHHGLNHARGTLREYGPFYAVRVLPQHAMLATFPTPVVRRLRQFKRAMLMKKAS